jgi:hypothetical protein
LKSILYISTGACLSVLTLASCGGGDGGLSSNSPGATSASATPIAAAIDKIGNNLNPGVPGWPSYIAMGGLASPNLNPASGYVPPSCNASGCTKGEGDDFQHIPVDAIFKYNNAGDGNPGRITSPWELTRLLADAQALTTINNQVVRMVYVEYTGQVSSALAGCSPVPPGNLMDLTNLPTGGVSCWPTMSYLMGRHFSSLIGDTMTMFANPITLNGQNYYGSIVLNPDWLGTVQQQGWIGSINTLLKQNSGSINTAVAQAVCLMTGQRQYTNTYDPNGSPTAPYLKTFGPDTPPGILAQMINAGYPKWALDNPTDPYWPLPTGTSLPPDSNSQIGRWFSACITPTYDKTKYSIPVFPDTHDGWVQAHNWIIRTFAPPINGQPSVTFGWLENPWAAPSTGYWVDTAYASLDAIKSAFSTPVVSWLTANAPSAVSAGPNTNKPDFLVFDRFERDDSDGYAIGEGALYNARSWDNYLNGIGAVSSGLGNIPLMMFQIPGAHIPYVGETNPELTSGSYTFGVAPDYFFGDSNLKLDLSNMVLGANVSNNPNIMVGNYLVPCGTTVASYICPAGVKTYQQWLNVNSDPTFQPTQGSYKWYQDNGRLKLAAQNKVFAILWGGGNSTTVINNSLPSLNDYGYLAKKLTDYHTNPTPLQ